MGFSDELNKHKRKASFKEYEEQVKAFKEDPNSIYNRLKAMPYTHWRLYFDTKYNYMDLRKEPRKEYEFKYIDKEK